MLICLCKVVGDEFEDVGIRAFRVVETGSINEGDPFATNLHPSRLDALCTWIGVSIRNLAWRGPEHTGT